MSCDITLVSIPLQVDANRCASVLPARQVQGLATVAENVATTGLDGVVWAGNLKRPIQCLQFHTTGYITVQILCE